jgi:tetratricopeptide (TPR) repeat protein
MKKIAAAAIILCFASSSFASDCKLANEGKAGLYANSIERVFHLNEQHIDIATAALLVSRHWNPDLNVVRYRDKIDEMACVIKERMQKAHTGTGPETIEIVNNYLYKELGFKAVNTAADPLDLFLDSVIERRQGYCLSLSILYLSLAERLNLPIYGVVAPGHFFVRYDSGGTRFNIETTSEGASPPDSHYITKFGITGKEPDSIYLKNLTKVQTLGCLFNNLGNLYQDANNIDAATWSLQAAVEINPSLALSHTNLGNVYLRRNMCSEAMAEYNKALRINDDDAKTHNNLGNALSSIGRYDEAIREYKLSIELDPNLTEAYSNMANAYQKSGANQQAVLALKKAMSFEPQNYELCARLGEVYMAMEDYDQAIFMFSKSIGIKPTTVAGSQLAYAYLQKGQYDYAIAQYRNTIEHDPLNAKLYYGLAQAYDKLGRADDEIAAYKQSLSIDPKMVAASVNLGNIYVEKKMYEAAIQVYKKAVAVEQDNALLHFNLGVALSRLEKHKEAAIEFTAAVKLDPKSAETHEALAVSSYMLKDYQQAWEHINIAKKLGFDVPKDLYDELDRRVNKSSP